MKNFNLYLFFISIYFFLNKSLGICEKIIAKNTIKLPKNSLDVITSSRSKYPARAAKTASKLKINEATTGFVYFLSYHCKV